MERGLIFISLLYFFVFVTVAQQEQEQEFGSDLPKQYRKPGLDVAIACPPRDSVALISLLKSISVNSNPHKIRIWVFSETQDVQTFNDLLAQNAQFYPKQNLKILGFEHNEVFQEVLTNTERTGVIVVVVVVAVVVDVVILVVILVVVLVFVVDSNSLLTTTIIIIIINLIDSPFMWDVYSPQRDKRKMLPHELVNYNRSLSSRYDYVRYYMASLFQSLPEEQIPERFLYLDVDSIVMGDLMEMLKEVGNMLGGGICLATARREFPLLSHSITPFVLNSVGFQPRTPAFDPGMMLIDTHCWIDQRILQKLLWWIDVRQNRVIFLKGAEPPILLSFYPLTSKIKENHKSAKYPRPAPMFFVRERWATSARNYVEPCSEVHKEIGLCPMILRFVGDKKPWLLLYQKKCNRMSLIRMLLPLSYPPTALPQNQIYLTT